MYLNGSFFARAPTYPKHYLRQKEMAAWRLGHNTLPPCCPVTMVEQAMRNVSASARLEKCCEGCCTAVVGTLVQLGNY